MGGRAGRGGVRVREPLCGRWCWEASTGSPLTSGRWGAFWRSSTRLCPSFRLSPRCEAALAGARAVCAEAFRPHRLTCCTASSLSAARRAPRCSSRAPTRTSSSSGTRHVCAPRGRPAAALSGAAGGVAHAQEGGWVVRGSVLDAPTNPKCGRAMVVVGVGVGVGVGGWGITDSACARRYPFHSSLADMVGAHTCGPRGRWAGAPSGHSPADYAAFVDLLSRCACARRVRMRASRSHARVAFACARRVRVRASRSRARVAFACARRVRASRSHARVAFACARRVRAGDGV